jgi:alcohol dehydrogenase class IV
MITGAYTPWGVEKILYGEELAVSLPREVARIGAKRVFVLGSASMAANGLIDTLQSMLGDRLVDHFVGMPQHMPRGAVLAAANQARSARADLIVTIGGGSVVDAGKMVQLCLTEGVTEAEQLDAFHMKVLADGSAHTPELKPPAIRSVAIPTTLSGGEFTGRAGCTDPETGMKHVYTHRDLAPRLVLLDPRLTTATPSVLWLSSGIRAVDHAVEGYCSVSSNPYADGLAINALRLLVPALRATMNDPNDLDARLNAQIGVWSATGVGQAGAAMGASHGIGHVLGAVAGVPHGFTSCVMLGPVLRYNELANSERQATMSALFGQPDIPAAKLIEDLVASLGLPGRLRDVGVEREQLPAIATNAMHDKWVHMNPRQITSSDQVMEILETAY